MERLLVDGCLAVFIGSYGLCVDRACPGSALDPLTCTTCCGVATVRGKRSAESKQGQSMVDALKPLAQCALCSHLCLR